MIVPRCIVTDLDRTLTGPDLVLDRLALDRMSALRSAGVLVIIATGRRYDDPQVMRLLPHVDAMVAENGAVVHLPRRGLLEVVDADFVEVAKHCLGELSSAFTWGRAIGSGPRELASSASERFFRARVSHTLEFNAEHVMLLPARVNKATGVDGCARQLGVTAAQAWAIGDGENDVALLEWAHVGAAPANAARPALEAADVLMVGAYSQGFLEFTDPLITGIAQAR